MTVLQKSIHPRINGLSSSGSGSWLSATVYGSCVFLILTLIVFLPLFANVTHGAAHQVADPVTINSLITKSGAIVQKLVVLLIGIAVLVILWGVVRYISHAGEEDKIKEARRFIVFGIIGLFVMVSVWALVNLLTQTVGFTTEDLKVPTLPIISPI